MRVWVVDPGLRIPDGHHLTSNLAIHEQCMRRGVAPVFIINRHFPDQCVAAGLKNNILPALPILDFSQYQCPYSSEEVIKHVKNFNGAYFAALDSLVTNAVSDGDLAFLHSIDASLINGLARWLVQKVQHKRFRTVIQLSGYDLTQGSDVAPWQRGIYRDSLKPLVELGPDRVLLVVETEGLRARIHEVAGFDCGLEISPHLKPEAPIHGILNRPRSVSDRPCVGFLGQARAERGVSEAMRAIVYFCDRHPGAAKFEVQMAKWQGHRLDTLRKKSPHFERDLTDLEALDNVHVIREPLSTSDYYDLLGRTDVVLQLKTGDSATRGSGVFLEALSAGKVMVLPHGTEQHKALEAAGGPAISVNSLEPADIADGLWRALENLDELREQARATAQAWNKAHSFSAFFDRIIDAPVAPRPQAG